MNLSSKIKRIGFPNPILPDDESRSLHERLIKENWTYRKQPNPKTFLKQRSESIDQISRNFVWDFLSATHLLKRATMGASINDINYFINLKKSGVCNWLPFLGPFGHFSIAYKYITT